jgi:HD-GYP domain-containing protein (c-di-GMP phosphodiesterase class II)
MVRKHPEAGYRIALSSPQLTSVAEYILTHHERWDGRGYPRGISGRSIPYVSRIFALLDAYDMMVNEQPYRSAMSREAALQEILDNGGRQFDPDLSQRFVDMMDNTDEETDK